MVLDPKAYKRMPDGTYPQHATVWDKAFTLHFTTAPIITGILVRLPDGSWSEVRVDYDAAFWSEPDEPRERP